jgi:hypothetical protein
VALDPTSAKLCVYEDSDGARLVAHLTGSVQLSTRDARTLAFLLDDGGAPKNSCDGLSPVRIQFRYDTRIVSLSAAGCGPELLSGPFGVTGTGSQALNGIYQPIGAHARQPSLIGDSLSQGVDRLERFFTERHLLNDTGETVNGVPIILAATEVFDPHALFDTIVWELPPAHLLSSVMSNAALVAVHRAPECNSAQLTGTWAYGGGGGQNPPSGANYGYLTFANRSDVVCSLHGRLSVHGVDSHGAPVTTTVSWPVPSPFVLSPHGDTHPTTVHTLTELVGSVGFGGNGSGDAGPSGFCADGTAPDARTPPATWILTNGPTTMRIPDGRLGDVSGDADTPFFSCNKDIQRLSSGPQVSN